MSMLLKTTSSESMKAAWVKELSPLGILKLIRTEGSENFNLLFLCGDELQSEVIEMMSTEEKNKLQRWQNLKELGMSTMTFESCEKDERQLIRSIDLELGTKTYQ